MVRKPKAGGKEELSLKDVLDLGGTEEDFQSLKDIQDGAGTAKTGEKPKQSLKRDDLKEFYRSVGFETVDNKMLDASDEDDSSDSEEVSKSSKEKSGKSTKSTRDAKVGSGIAKTKSTDDKTKKGKKVGSEASGTSKKNDVKVPTKKPLQVSIVSSTVCDVAKLPVQIQNVSKSLPVVYSHIADLAKIPQKKIVMKTSGPWYANDTFKMSAGGNETYKSSDPMLVRLKDLGKELLETEANLMKNHKNKSLGGNDSWMKTVSTAGTLSDKVAAYTLMIQQTPVHNYRSLDMFLGMLKKKGKREALIALEALQNIFLAELLPDGRQLRYFHQQPIRVLREIFQREQGAAALKRAQIQRHLIQWAYEAHLKEVYKTVIECLRDVFLQDTLEAMKMKGLRTALNLIKSKPEQERELLVMIVNKMGDPKHKIASKALHTLHSLIQEHPVMQGVVVSAVRDLLLRPNIQAKCQYYCICFMSSQILSNDRKDVADLLVQIYLAFFKACVKQKRVDNKLLGAILTGVNRAYPFTNTDDEKIMEELNILYKTIHVSSFGTSVQAMMLLFQVLSSRNELNDRFYNALYSTLLHPELSLCTHRHPMYLNLVFRSLKADPSESRVKAFLKRLVQSCTLQLPAYVSAVLVLITELIRVRPNLNFFLSGTKKGGVQDDSDEEHFVDLDEDGGVEKTEQNSNNNPAPSQTSWKHISLKSGATRTTTYDAMHRTPAYSSADASSLWEIARIQNHYHPAVAKFAEQLMDSHLPDSYPGDPLADFTLMRFLDKFVYRNPKARSEKEAKSNSGERVFRRKRKLHMANPTDVAANTPEFLQKQNYEPEEVFLQRYFASKSSSAPPSKMRKTAEDDDVEELSDDEFDKFLDSAEGQTELETEYKFAEGTTSSNKHKKTIVPAVEEDEYDDVDFDEQDEGVGGEMGFADVDEDEVKTSARGKKEKNSEADFEAFDMMMEENSRQKYVGGGSDAVRNADNSNSRQLKWERKREMKDIVARKRSAKRTAPGFKKSGGRPARGPVGKSKKGGFSKRGRQRR